MNLKNFISELMCPKTEVGFSHCRPSINSPHWVGVKQVLPHHLIVYVESGALDLGFKSGESILKAGDICWLPPGTHRNFRCVDTSTSTYNWRFRFSVRKAGKELCVNTKPVIRACGNVFLPHLQLIQETLNDYPQRKIETTALLVAFSHRFHTLYATEESHVKTLTPVQKRRVDKLVNRELLGNISPSDMADAAGLSPDYFTRIFRNTYGVPPRRHLVNERMRLAAEILLDSALNINELCAEIGEPDAGTFCRMFKKVMGCTPTEYRRMNMPSN